MDQDRYPTLGEQAVQRGVVTGTSSFNLGVNVNYRLFKLDRSSLRVGYCEFNSGPAGNRFSIPPVPLRDMSGMPDADSDGLADIAEFVLGTNPTDPDSDDDGVLDGAAAQAGTLNSPLLPTGLIASVQLPGHAQDVCAVNDVAVVALGSQGVALCNIFTRMNPIVIGLLDTPGEALRVAATGTLIAVAGGPGGLTVIGFSDPPATPLLHEIPALLLGGEARSVAAVAGLAFVGLSTGRLVVVDLASGTILESVQLGANPVADVFIAGDAIYAADTTTLYTLALQPGRLAVASAVSCEGIDSGRRVFAGGGVAYVTHVLGPNTFSLADPLHPSLIATSFFTGQVGWRQIVLNGSGLGLAAAGASRDFVGNDALLYDTRDPAQTKVFLRQIATPGDALSVAIYDGLGYVADGDRGLHVVNYVGQDRLGIAPTVSLTTSQPRIDRAEEGALLRISPVCQDDVQVRSCELFVDGVKTETDGSFPYDFYLTTPRLSDRAQLTVRVRVSDTGGNSRFSDPLVITLTPDATAPVVTRRVPAPGAVLGLANTVAVFTTEPLLLGSAASRFVVSEAGADRVHGTADDVTVAGQVEVRPTVRGTFFQPSSGVLLPGRYRAAIGSGVTDPSGNALAPTSWTFVVYGSAGADRDGDGVPDELEALLGLNPDDPDSNHDGVRDGQEDFEHDGVPNAVEVALGFDLTSPDTDGDGVLDRNVDRDFDRLSDAQEVALGTSPFAVDSDGDGYSDVDEVTHGSDPVDPASVPVRAALVGACVLNRADPQATLGRALVPFTSRNDASPDAVANRSSGRPTSVRNDH